MTKRYKLVPQEGENGQLRWQVTYKKKNIGLVAARVTVKWWAFHHTRELTVTELILPQQTDED